MEDPAGDIDRVAGALWRRGFLRRRIGAAEYALREQV
jgi:hypothetical protein